MTNNDLSSRRAPVTRTRKNLSCDPHPQAPHAPFDPQPSTSSSKSLSNGIEKPANSSASSKRPTRQIKTRSMTSGNAPENTVAFGGTVPQRIIPNPQPKKHYKSSARLQPKDHTQIPTLTRDLQTTKCPDVIHSRPPSTILAKGSSTTYDNVDHESVGKSPLRLADRRADESGPHANSNLTLASYHHSPRSCSSTAPFDSHPSFSSEEAHIHPPPTLLRIPSNSTDTIQSPSIFESSATSTTAPGSSSLASNLPIVTPGSVNAGRGVQGLSTLPNRVAQRAARPREKPAAGANKRLFEEIDDNTDKNLFAFLDVKGKGKQVTKPATRPVFKMSQPSATRNARMPAARTAIHETQSSKARRKITNITQAQAGQPQRKKGRSNSPDVALNLVTSRSTGLEPRPIRLTTDTTDAPLLQAVLVNDTPEPAEHNSANEPHPLTSRKIPWESAPQTDPLQLLDTVDITTSLHDEPAAPINHPSEAMVVNPFKSPETKSLHDTQVSTLQQSRIEQLPLPQEPLICSPQASTSDFKLNNNAEGKIEEDQSADAIDFLSPQKRHDPPLLNIKTHPSINPRQVTPTPATLATSNAGIHDTGDPAVDSSSPLTPVSSSAASSADSDLVHGPLVSPDRTDHTSLPQSEDSKPLSPEHDLAPSHQQPPANLASTNEYPPSPLPDRQPTPPLKSQVSTPPQSPKPPSRAFQPIRTSPIKEATMPTSIPPHPSRSLPIPPPQHGNTPGPFQLMPRPGGSSVSTVTGPFSRKPSMLPRRTFKQGSSAMPSMSLNTPLSLDAIVENSPAKPTVRDALSSSSLNLSRGSNIPPKVIFTGGIKAKAEEFFTRQSAMLKHSLTSSSMAHSAAGDLAENAGQLVCAEEVEGNQMGAEEDDGLADTTANSISTNHSTVSTSSSSSGNMSQDTQDRLSKLQAMLTRMNLPRADQKGMSESKSESTGLDRATGAFTEYEVPLKDDEEELAPHRHRLRKRSLSASSNMPSYTAIRAKNRQSSAGFGRQALGTSQGANSRRQSNILPSANIHSQAHQPVEAGSDADKSAPSRRLTDPNGGRVDRVDRSKTALPLKDVVALVDVRTAEGDDAGKVFVEMLKGLGAKVQSRPTQPLTHIVFKAGKQTTIDRWLVHPKPKPSLVGIGWVVRCREVLGKASEAPYVIDINSTSAPVTEPVNLSASVGPSTTAGASNRRKSMEPKALALLNHGLQLNDRHRNVLSQSCAAKPVDKTQTAQSHRIAESIERVRRKSLQFLPKVGSPLATKVYVHGEEEVDDSTSQDLSI